ncbi:MULTISPECIES: KpsF/GutQ family sugar-phosphate isomerase [unclassified Halomonas]|uniref:KpsF/GutQ family sugar-phosphate isomerase n=1 Tax=unclassified Halomonas TaxID=2609666 RepID=UPI002885686D|nr:MULTISPECIES: KpsF/GutQ family sugar-phosphate isomerase [unclassified Halomonas]MDT0500205.1 KpsF/GutQ family sugar-phosphate isomerase [Halomonas sp. PAR7]MDT0511301.1 KpsF/GutQ family sugar-phosphate isomerase [Halomonas sp. LES1]MDT0590411.1 KpsF/GutQ family sugar-phosphate isomerase [Halomonas sp. PAR8]
MTSETPGAGSALRDSARRTLRLEQQAIGALAARLDEAFDHACELILACRGRVVVTGMGKSGHIAGKIAATLASTGTPAFFVHPGEASHGDLGMITPGDVVLALSNSGETAEVTALLPLLKRMKVPLISMTGRPTSSLGRHADAHLDTGVEREACPLDLAPTASTTAALAMGDALAVALLESRGFTAEDFALSHPGGSLGKRLLLRVSDLMHSGSRLPRVPLGSPLRDALLEITRQGLGFTCVVAPDGRLAGVYTDGDLRRTLDLHSDLSGLSVDDVMTCPGKRTTPETLAAEAVSLMEDHRISALAVVDDEGRPVGALHMHDLLASGVI